jgi:hypothetical protein
MDAVSGSVKVRETGFGIPGLLVSVFDVDDEQAAVGEFRGSRLGSVLTDGSGRFELSFERAAGGDGGTVAPVASPNLAIVVSAAEGPAEEGGPAVLHRSPKPRAQAGHVESFSIRLPAEVLRNAGIEPPAEMPDPDADLGVLRRRDERTAKLEGGLRELVEKRIKEDQELDADFDRSYLPALRKRLSTVPVDVVDRRRRVQAPEEIEPKNRQAVHDGIAGRFQSNGAERIKIRTRFHLTEAQAKRVDELSQQGQKPLTGPELRRVLLDSAQDTPPVPAVLVDEPTLLKEFLERTHQEKCSEEHLGLAGEPHEEAGPGDPPGAQPDLNSTPFTDSDIPRLMARLLSAVAPPEQPVAFAATQQGRADAGAVQSTVDAFAMRPGPADVPALFDFHRLEIAFDHVWQEIIDETLIDVARELHHRVRGLGGDPAVRPGMDPIRAIQRATQRVERVALRPSGRLRFESGAAFNVPAKDPASGATLDPPAKDPGSDGRSEDVAVRPPSGLLTELEELLQQSHAFTVYGAEAGSRSVNFGLVVTYRQEWVPVTYQAGPLVKTIPLAPGEARRVTRKTVIRRKRAEKELERSSVLRREELNQTSRAESDIVRKAMAKTNFSLTAEGTYNLGVASGESTTKLGRDAQEDSRDAKKEFREAVHKAAHEYKQERSTEITSEVSTEFEEGETSELVNKNDELHVTYLLYELQRRYRVTESIHRATPVVLVAQEVPNPSQITDAWLLAHDWVLSQVLLHDQFRPALEYLSRNVAGDRLALATLKSNVDNQRAIVKDLQRNLVAMEDQAGRRYEALLRAVEDRIGQVAQDEEEGFLKKLGESIGIGASETPEAARMREEAASDAEQRAVDKVKELAMRLQREVTALNEITEKYARLRSEQRNREVQIARLRVHVARNILFYMQAIWAFEVPDQRYLRLHQTKVPVFSDGGTQYMPTGETAGVRIVGLDGTGVVEAVGHEFEVTPEVQILQGEQTLAEVAHLDDLLGFRGNYLLFPLKEPNPLTEFMLAPYVDAGWKLMDPDDPAGLSLHQFARYVCFLHERLTPDEFEALKEDLKRRYQALLQDPQRQAEEIVVPTDSLFIEALPGAHPVLEDFKLIHRAVDVKKAQSDARESELENLRLAARLLGGELEDPDVERKIVIEGDNQGIVVPAGDQ